MNAPEVSYARSGDVSLAYVVTGNGAIDLVFVHGYTSNLETEQRRSATGSGPSWLHRGTWQLYAVQ